MLLLKLLSLTSYCIFLFQLRDIVSSFGQLAAYRFLFNEDLGGACAFLEVWKALLTPKLEHMDIPPTN